MKEAVPLSLFGEEISGAKADTASSLSTTAPQVADSPQAIPQKTLAPMLQSYVEMKRKFDSHILLFQVGDFYEIFFEDARLAAEALNIRLTSRDKNSSDPIPMCGVPVHAIDSYLPRLLAAGFSVALVSQVDEQKGKNGKTQVKRELTRIITPGVRFEGEGLDEKSFNFCAAVLMLPEGGAVAAIDCSTGHLRLEECDSIEEISEILARLRVRELLVPSTLFDRPIDKNEKWYRESRDAAKQLGASTTQRAFVEGVPKELRERIPAEVEKLSRASRSALKAILAYAEEISCGRLPPIGSVTIEDRRRNVLIDAATCRNLEITETRIDGGKKNSLLSHIDHSCTAMGARLLAEWITMPSAYLEEIKLRHDAVEELLKDSELLDRVRQLLREVRDLERVLSRIVTNRGTPRDLAVLRDSIRVFPHLEMILKGFKGKLLQDLVGDFPNLVELHEKLLKALVEEPPLKMNEGDIFRDEFNEELDRLRLLRRDGNKKLLEMEQREKTRTGISSLKIRYNNVFGYSIEISKTHLTKVPSDYERRQTLANAERYITAELKHFESDLLSAKEKIFDLERDLFLSIRDEVSALASQIQQAARIISNVDVLSSFAELAWKQNYVRPEMTQEGELLIEEGRHPVVERVIGSQNFVANNTSLDTHERRFAVLTGPNMGGKSTYLRQIGLIQLLAQAGSFVPAKRAVLGFVDRIFTRIGAADDLSRGDSTFMVEMRETSTILRRASSRSLVLIDEIGRGTATIDGRAIATAVADYLHEQIRCRTVFATHFHELTSLAEREGIFCLTVGVHEEGDEIFFTHRILEQIGDKSYGIEVARLAGLPHEVLDRARIYFESSDTESPVKFTSPLPQRIERVPTKGNELLSELKEIEVEKMTPLDALLVLSRLKRSAET